MIKKVVAAALVCAVACSCGNRSANEQIYTSPDIDKSIRLATAERVPYSIEFRTVGTVGAENGKIAHIAAPFDGRITSAKVKIGQKVTAGQTIFELSSSDFLDVVSSYFQTKQTSEQVTKNLERKKKLLDKGIVSARELEEAEVEAVCAQNEFYRAKESLKIFNVNPNDITVGDPLRVVSPLSGEVVALDITPGDYIKSDDEPLATVVDLQEVWVKARIKEHYIGLVKNGDNVNVFTDAEPETAIIGKIYNVGEIVDEQSRTIDVIIVCNNSERKLKLGMFTTVRFSSEPQESIIIPATAVFQAEESGYVYLKSEDGSYARRNVEVTDIGDGQLRVLSGLKEGEVYVADGGLLIK
ncbi:MAG: efflux RND transporter periplasmic adaptor subunit [Bacteroidales bacterium]|nr:efflux RND transporter periplasmic adaptor subunit [Bacteroidales bacterium]